MTRQTQRSLSGWRRLAAPAALAGSIGLAGGLALAVVWHTGSPAAAAAALAAGALLICFGSDRLSLARRRRLGELRGALEALAEGDVTQRLAPERMAELAGMAETFNRLSGVLDRSAHRIVEITRQLQRVPDRIAEATEEIQEGADQQEAAVEETASLLANINTSISDINGEVDHLAHFNEETSSSVLQMGVSIDQVARSATALQQTVESSTTSVHQMGDSVHRVAESGESVKAMAEQTASAITEMDRAIQEVGEHARGASDLTERVSVSAEQGTHAVGATIDSIAEARELSADAKSAVESLAERIGEIGEIATVIGGISDETNLLSLNAAIIAAQAGEHGKAFAVVADQVKTLARRTTASTKQIELLIQAVQKESTNAVQAMEAGIGGVEQGVQRSRGAGEALEVIRTSAREASGRVAEIARSAEEQARNSKHVAEAAQRTFELIQLISLAMAEQTEASERLLENANASLEMCRQMSRSTQEQGETGRYISSNIESVTEMIRSIQANTASHQKASAAVADTFAAIVDNAHEGTRRIPEVLGVISELREQAEALGAEVARFEPAASRSAANHAD